MYERSLHHRCRYWCGLAALLWPILLRGQTGWRMSTPLPSPMGEIMGEVVAGKWYVLAGLDAKTATPIGAVYVSDPSSNAWTAKRSMPVPAHHIMAATMNGKIYVFGGFVKAASVAARQPVNKSWS